MTWLIRERKTWSLDAMLFNGLLGSTECTANASIRLGAVVATPRTIPTQVAVPDPRMPGNSKALFPTGNRRCRFRLPHRVGRRKRFFGFGDDVFARVRRSLHPEQSRVAAIELHQLGVRALLDQASVLEENDAVGPPHRREPVRDVHSRAAARERSQALEQVVLRLRVEGRR